MAFYFLVLSKTYTERTDPTLAAQREVVCALLKDSYKAVRGKDSAIFGEAKNQLKDLGVELSDKDYLSAKVFLRSLYLWLRATTEEERSTALQGKQARLAEVIDWLRVDGIQTWADVVRLAPQGSVSSSPPVEEAEPEEVTQTVDRRARLRELGAGEEMADLLEKLWPSVAGVLEENKLLREEIEVNAEELATVRIQAETAQEFVTLLEGDNDSLEARLRAAQESLRRAHTASLEEIAQQHPEVPQLFSLAQSLKTGKGWREKQIGEISSTLPGSFSWQSETGIVKYQDRFLRLLARTSEEDRDRIVRQLETLAKEGSEYASLCTRKNHWGGVPYTPTPCFSSRGTDEWRFSWVKEPGVITLYWLYRKNETRVSQSEA